MSPMGRKRRDRRDLPERVYFKHGAYYFVSKDGAWHRLGTDYTKALTKYGELNSSGVGFSMSSIIDRYMREIAPTKAPRTFKNYLREVRHVRSAFGHMLPDEITPPHIYAYLDTRAPVAGNREKALLSTIISYAVRWGLASDNPCRLVKRNPESPRDRHIEEWEYRAIHALARPMLQIAMDLARTTGLRQGDILKLKLTDAKEDGLLVHTNKTSKRLIFALTPGLQAILDRSKAIQIKGVQPLHPAIIRNRSGRAYTGDGFRAVWQDLIVAAIKAEVIKERFTFHDLRAKAADGAENASELLGHDDPKTTNRVYRRAPRRVTPVKY